MPSLIKKAKVVLSHAYMAQELLSVTDTLPGWEGFPVRLYEYQTGNDLYTGKPKTGKIYLLDPIDGQSNAQFPVKGLLYEDQYTRNFQEPYLFKDGITVYIKDTTMWPKDKTCTPEELNFYLYISNDDLKPQTGQYARIASTTREDYKIAGCTEDVGDKNDRKQKWLEVVRDLYKKAWNSDKNELIIMWANNHLK
ncbi:MAG TPA: hypothetical protein VMU83_25000 [Hanamia sp.]|nr:hypothetical protein [Hanamia sp.]